MHRRQRPVQVAELDVSWLGMTGPPTAIPVRRCGPAGHNPALKARGHAGNRCLHQQWCRVNERKKNHVVANVAIGRELAGWCWSLATWSSHEDDDLIGFSLDHGEISELDLRYNYEPQGHSTDCQRDARR